MRIGELSRRTGVDQRLLRYYEGQGLLRPSRQPNGYRAYRENDVAVVLWIRRLLAAGMSTTTIAGFMACVAEGYRPDGDCGQMYDRMLSERAKINAAIADLEDSRAVLDDLIAGNTPTHDLDRSA